MNAFRLRGTIRGIAAILLAVVLGGAVHMPTGQDECVPAPERHDESHHAFAPAVELRHDHCAICHWQRLQRPAFTQLSVEIPAFLSTTELASFGDAAPGPNSSSQLPARAPPASTL